MKLVSSTLVAFTHVCQIINKFQDFHFEKSNILENSVFPFTTFCYLIFILFFKIPAFVKIT